MVLLSPRVFLGLYFSKYLNEASEKRIEKVASQLVGLPCTMKRGDSPLFTFF